MLEWKCDENDDLQNCSSFLAMSSLRDVTYFVAVVAVVATAVQISGPSKPFRKVVACNGSDLCALDVPSVGFSLDVHQSNSRNLPGAVRCTAMCKIEPLCTSVNYRGEVGECELFFFVPIGYGHRPYCHHFEGCLVFVLTVTTLRFVWSSFLPSPL